MENRVVYFWSKMFSRLSLTISLQLKVHLDQFPENQFNRLKQERSAGYWFAESQGGLQLVRLGWSTS